MASSSICSNGTFYQTTQRHQWEIARCYQRTQNETASADNDSEGKLDENDVKQLEDVKTQLAKELFGCDEECLCSLTKLLAARLTIEQEGNKHEKERKPLRKEIKSVISHRFHNGQLFLYCVRNSKCAHPEYLRLCQVPRNLRLDYRKYLEKHGTPPLKKNFWTLENELDLREALDNHPFTEKYARQQLEIEQCLDTNEWSERTANGSKKMILRGESVVDHPPPVLTTEDGEVFWDAECILGALQEKGTGKLWFLVKWKGYPHDDNTWQDIDSVKMAKDLIKQFYDTYGKPTAAQPKILSPDGIRFDKWVKDYENGIKRPLKKQRGA